MRGRSICLKCEESLGPLDLVPVISFFILRGRCRHCKAAIDWQYPLVELATGTLFLLFYFKYARMWFGADSISSISGMYLFASQLIFIPFLVIIFVYDLRHMTILDKFTIPAMTIAAIVNLWTGAVSAPSMLVGAIVFAGFFYAQFALSQGTWVGGGDIRLGALMGFMLGFQHGIVALFLAYLLGALVGVVLLLFKKADRKTPLPFGTFLTLATTAILFFGETPLNWYLSFFA